MQLSQKLKNLSELFSKFLKSTSNFEHFQKKYEPDSWFTSENIDWKMRCFLDGLKAPC